MTFNPSEQLLIRQYYTIDPYLTAALQHSVDLEPENLDFLYPEETELDFH